MERSSRIVKKVFVRFIGLVRFVVSIIFRCSSAVGLHKEGAMNIVTVATSVIKTIGASTSLAVTVVLLTTNVDIRSIERFSDRGTCRFVLWTILKTSTISSTLVNSGSGAVPLVVLTPHRSRGGTSLGRQIVR